MERKRYKQVLSNETLNSQGFRVINDSISWDRYKLNPILLRNKNDGEHFGMPVGHIDPKSIRLEDGKWIGEIIFDTTEDGKFAETQYRERSLNAVSIFGKARIVEQGGERFTTFFDIWEISLVNIPANPDAVAIRDEQDETGLCAEFKFKEIEKVVSLSAHDRAFINKLDKKMEEKNENVKSQEETISLSVLDKILDRIGLAPRDRRERRRDEYIADELRRDARQDRRDADQDRRDAGEDRRVARRVERDADLERYKDDDDDRDEEDREYAERRRYEARRDDRMAERDDELARKDEREERRYRRRGLSATEEAEPVAQKKDKAEVTALNALPTSLDVNPKANVKDIHSYKVGKSMVPEFSEYIKEKENIRKINRISALSAETTSDMMGLSAALNPDVRKDIQELALSIQSDSNVMAALGTTDIQVNDGRRVMATETIAALASGANSSKFILESPDLAKIVFLPLYVRELFPSNSFAERIRRISVRDTKGVIWIEGAADPAIYFGDRSPVNAPDYLYDDKPRGMVAKVWNLQPMLWQTVNNDLLSYNAVATGSMEGMRKMISDIHNYWLQQIAEAVPAENQLAMSGDQFAATGRFPINAAATGNLKGMTINDLLMAQGIFQAQNLTVNEKEIMAVLATPYVSTLQMTAPVQSILTQQLSNAGPQGFDYSGFQVRGRSLIAAYNTTTSTVVDAEAYMDFPVDFATGAIDTSHTKPVLTAATYDVGLAFLPDQVVAGIGNTHIHMVSDPNNYGWKMSMTITSGASTLRSDAKGVVLFKPTVVAGA